MTVESARRQVADDLGAHVEDRLRSFLVTQDREWLIDQIVRLALDTQRLQERDLAQRQEARATCRAERLVRVRALGMNAQVLTDFLERYRSHDRATLIREGYLLASVPPKGTRLIGDADRTAAGSHLLQHAKDVLFSLLFGDESIGTSLARIQRELLTFTLPRFKAEALDFMKAATELRAAGTWQDPSNVSHDSRTDNVLVEVEFGEVEGELVGDGIVRCLSLINDLEVNEQILYARMINVEQTTLIA
jgi:hypothetical protein